MRYIKTFEGKITQNYLEDLQDFINANLAYLLDMGPMYSGYVIQDKFKSRIELTIRFSVDDLAFKWDDVKDYIIPFITRMDREYKIHEIKAFCSYYRYKIGRKELINVDDIIPKEDIINDRLELENYILNRMEIIIE